MFGDSDPNNPQNHHHIPTKQEIQQDQLAKQAHYNNYYLSDPKLRKTSGGGNSGVLSGGNLSGGGAGSDSMVIRNLKNVTSKSNGQKFQLTAAGQTILNSSKQISRPASSRDNADFEKKLHEKLMQNQRVDNSGFNIVHMG